MRMYRGGFTWKFASDWRDWNVDPRDHTGSRPQPPTSPRPRPDDQGFRLARGEQ